MTPGASLGTDRSAPPGIRIVIAGIDLHRVVLGGVGGCASKQQRQQRD
jgi:hypothetical protein